NIECGVAFNGGGGSMIYYSFNEPALNGFSPILKTKYDNHPLYRLIDEISVPVRSLESILDEYLPQETHIDFLSVDVEGLDLEVLKSNNWDKYRPKVVVVECWDSDLENIYHTETYSFLSSQNYKLFAKTINTLFFKEK
ncbi:FkbM family methyltransferase, partial [Helicobacter cinaedi]